LDTKIGWTSPSDAGRVVSLSNEVTVDRAHLAEVRP
jgi:hypothetical protein